MSEASQTTGKVGWANLSQVSYFDIENQIAVDGELSFARSRI